MLDREQVGLEEAVLDDEEDDEFLKAFKVYFIISSSTAVLMFTIDLIHVVFAVWPGGVSDFFFCCSYVRICVHI